MHISNLTAALALAVTLASCSSPAPTNTDNSPHTRDVFAMDTYMSMKAYGENGEKALSEAEKYIKKLESDLSATSPDSCISRVNSADSKPTEVTDEAAEIIAKALEIGKKTNGALDITLYPMLKEWGFTTGEYQIPKTEDISRILGNTGFERVQLSGNTITVPDGFQIDLGALAKGFTSDKIMDIMRKNNVSSAIVSLGGNVQAVGTKPDGSQWKVAVRDPFAPDTDMCVVEIGSKAVITSGNYERFFTGSDGKNYWHILDPSDGFRPHRHQRRRQCWHWPSSKQCSMFIWSTRAPGTCCLSTFQHVAPCGNHSPYRTNFERSKDGGGGGGNGSHCRHRLGVATQALL